MTLNLKKKLFVLLKILLSMFLVFFILNLFFPLKINIDYSKTVSDSEGDILYCFLSKDDKWRMYTELHEISPDLKKAIVYKEDKFFYWHFGINPIAIARAFWNNSIQNKRTSGASTITMQVARLLHPKKRSYANKIIEMFRAIQLEWSYSKDEILQFYLNLVPYGSNIEGVKSAAVLYLEKQPDHLSLAEITALSIIPNRPTSLLPGKNNALIIKERNKWLKRFLADQIFKKEAIEDALLEDFKAFRHQSPKSAPHFSFRMKNKFSFLNNIKTNLNSAFQKKTEAIVNNFMQSYKGQHINNAAIIIIDNQNKNVLSYVGSQDFFDELNSGQVDGVNSVRQPGSTLKPLLYGLAIDQGILSPKSVLTDVPINYDGYAPVNYNKKFNGYVTTEYALAHSLNVPAVKVLKEMGTKKLINKLIQCNFKSISRQKDILGLSVILGGCGTTLEELSTLYSAYANNGKYKTLNWLNNIDSKGIQQDSSITILSKQSNYMISEMMTNLERPDLPNFWQNTKDLPKIAWKTGTSYGRKDAWSIGFNHKYTVGVWLGNFSGEGVPDMTGAKNASPILFNVFKSIDQEHSRSWLKKPKELDIRLVCSATGNIPSPQCDNTVFDYFIPLVSPHQTCTHLSKIIISENDSTAYCMDCAPNNGYKTKWIKNHSPEMIAYFEKNYIGYQKIPAHNPMCSFIHSEGAPIIVSPKNGSEYYIDKAFPEEIMLQCQASKDASKIFWYINDVFYGTSFKNEKLFFKAKEGKNKISCSDDLGRNSNIWIHVKHISL